LVAKGIVGLPGVGREKQSSGEHSRARADGPGRALSHGGRITPIPVALASWPLRTKERKRCAAGLDGWSRARRTRRVACAGRDRGSARVSHRSTRCDDVRRHATRRLVRRTTRQRDADARGRCLGARRAPAHCGAHLVVGRRRHRRHCGDADDVRGGSGPLHAPAPRTFLTLAAVNWVDARFPQRRPTSRLRLGWSVRGQQTHLFLGVRERSCALRLWRVTVRRLPWRHGSHRRLRRLDLRKHRRSRDLVARLRPRIDTRGLM